MVDDVQAVENDNHDLSPVELDRIMQHYRDPSGGSRQTLGELSLDLTGGFVSYTDRQPDRQITDPIDRVLAQYVQMLYHDRNLDQGTRLPIKDIDLSVLRLALSVREPEVVRQIETIQGQRSMGLVPVRLPLLAAGGAALAGAVALGFLLAGPTSTVEQGPVTPAPEQAPQGSVAPPEALANTEASVIPQEITVEIGEAVTLVRPPGG